MLLLNHDSWEFLGRNMWFGSIRWIRFVPPELFKSDATVWRAQALTSSHSGSRGETFCKTPVGQLWLTYLLHIPSSWSHIALTRCSTLYPKLLPRVSIASPPQCFIKINQMHFYNCWQFFSSQETKGAEPADKGDSSKEFKHVSLIPTPRKIC